jgi:hypothetical protein
MPLPIAALVVALDLHAQAAEVAQATRTTQAPVIDGKLDEPDWGRAPPTTGFTQFYPLEGHAPAERTEMRVLYDAHALYVGFTCEQVHLPIIERLTRRDRDSESEWVAIRLDPKNEAKMAYIFAVNVSGVLLDGIVTPPGNLNTDWDEVWEGRATRTPTGWSAEMRIPFRALRFDGSLPVQTWSVQGGRYIAQNQETDVWPPLPRAAANPISYFGRLEGLSGLEPQRALELLPFVSGRVRRFDATAQTSASGYDLGGSAGLDLRLHLAEDLTLDAAFNPDFAQVEADQIILNLTNYETLLPEKRPLFLEGADVFSFPIQMFYSRRIGLAPPTPTLSSDPNAQKRLVNVPEPATIYGAAKLTGRVGTNWTLGLLTAVTAQNDVVVQDDMQGGARSSLVVAPLTAFNVLRLKREWAGVGHVGLMATSATGFERSRDYPVVPVPAPPAMPPPQPGVQPMYQVCPSGTTPLIGSRCFQDSYVGGFDGLWRSPSGDYVASAAVIGSLVEGGAAAPQLDGTTIGPGARGLGGWARVAKEGGKHLVASATYTGAGRYLDYDIVGYMPRQNLQELDLSLGYRTLEPGRFTYETLSSLDVSQKRSLTGLDLGQLYSLSTRLRLSSFWYLFVAADAAPPRYDDREVGNGAALERAGYLGGRLELWTDPKRAVVVGLTGLAQAIQHDAGLTTAVATVTIKPAAQLELSIAPQVTWSAGEPRYTHLDPTPNVNATFGDLTAKSTGATLRAEYTFTPRLTLQAYAQAFLASGHYDDLRVVAAPSGARVSLAALAAAPPPMPPLMPGQADFEQSALNLSVVFRWEYRLGSTLFIVYSRSQVPDLPTPTAPAMLRPGALGRGASADVLLLKLNIWFAI